MRPGKLPTPFSWVVDVCLALGWIAICFALYSLMGCVSVQDSGEEPIWKPHVYLYSPQPDGRCAFVDGKGHIIDCDEPVIHEHYLAPLEDLVTLKSKLHQCQQWR